MSQSWQTHDGKWTKSLHCFPLIGSFCKSNGNEECHKLWELGSYYYTIRSKLEKRRRRSGVPRFFNLIQMKWFWDCSESRGDCIPHLTGYHHCTRESRKKTMYINKADIKMSSMSCLFLSHIPSDCEYSNNQYSQNRTASRLTQHKHKDNIGLSECFLLLFVVAVIPRAIWAFVLLFFVFGIMS